jgi:hypothetical protein
MFHLMVSSGVLRSVGYEYAMIRAASGTVVRDVKCLVLSRILKHSRHRVGHAVA